jgi:hypothetical protein
MPRKPKLHTWLKPGSHDYKVIVHCYFHLLQEERFTVLAELARQSGAPWEMLKNFEDGARHHGQAFDYHVQEVSQFAGYLLERQYEMLEWRLAHQVKSIMSQAAQAQIREKRDRSTAARRARKARYN